jgi:hypothetical protein
MIVSWGGRASRRSLASLVLVCGVMAVTMGPPSAGAASLALTDAQMREALRTGAASLTVESFDAEWRVTGSRGDSVLVVTPFHRLAAAARNAAFKNEEVRPGDVTRMLREQRDRLVVWATLRGERADFARYLRPELSVGDRVIKPAFVQNEHTPAPTGDGGYIARCVWWFPTTDLTGKSRLLLAIRDTDGRETHTFTIDLARMR